ncbi:RNA-directed DNA polymerase, eukaryota, reverse transcriptase zinc-binding domain protein [Tanacetum coccineum]
MDLKIASWNIRGLCKIRKHNAVKELIVDENVSICDVLETRLKGDKVKKIGKRLFGRWSWYDNSMECSRGCRILVGWDSEKIQCNIVHASYQAVLCLFEIQSSNKRLFCTFVHAEISGKLRKKLWNDLNIYKAVINDGPWVIMGDLNVSLNIDDHSEGIYSMTQDMEEFKECINDLKMEDICRSGLHYTWIMSLLNPNSSILKKIDRVMGNEEFLEEYFRAHVVFLPYGISDHSPVVLTCPQTIKAKSRSFRFANYIADKDDFLGVIKDNWKTGVEGFAMFKLAKKLKALKPTMNKLNWKNGNLFENVKKLKKDLDEVQKRIDADPNNSLLREQGVGLFKEYSLDLEDEEKLLLQKSKVEWLKEGDKNSAYFHKVLKSIDAELRKFVGRTIKIDDQEACRMINEVSSKEIKEALFDIDDNKALRPDGYTAKFFKQSWNVIGEDVCNAVKEFFSKGKLLKELNATLITLVPKGDPLSLYLFTLVMEVFKLILHQEILRNGRFKYHHGCKELEITHLCFADDLLVLCHRDINSVQVIKDALKKFSAVSRLYPNLGKSTIFCGSMDKCTIDSILQILPFKRGKLHGFIWNSGDLQRGKAKVAWKEVCQPKMNGGLGLKPLESWNNALLIKHLWNVADKKDSLWVKWISNIKLRGRSVWWSDKPSIDTIVSRRDIYTAGFNNNDNVFSCIKEN